MIIGPRLTALVIPLKFHWNHKSCRHRSHNMESFHSKWIVYGAVEQIIHADEIPYNYFPDERCPKHCDAVPSHLCQTASMTLLLPCMYYFLSWKPIDSSEACSTEPETALLALYSTVSSGMRQITFLNSKFRLFGMPRLNWSLLWSTAACISTF